MKKKLKKPIILLIIAILIIGIISAIILTKDDTELRSVKSEKELMELYDGKSTEFRDVFIKILAMPFSTPFWNTHRYPVYYNYSTYDKAITNEAISSDSSLKGIISTLKSTSATKDFSTTNIQVENVDEADITKTDGDYIYSISEDKVIITNVIDPKNIKIESTISSSGIPDELILSDNKLVIISNNTNSSSSYYSNYNSNTIVKIYDITDKSTPRLIKSFELYEPYYTSRCIKGKLYIISSGNLKKENDEIITYYVEDNESRNIELDNIKYLNKLNSRKQTLIAYTDLNNITQNINVNSYLMDISNAYVSENAIYLLDQKYENSADSIPISAIFGWKGVFGIGDYIEEDYNYEYHTDIYKFNIESDGQITYKAKRNVKGKTINQYSLDELNGHIRIALYDNDGARVVILDESMNEIGASSYLAKGEKMYSSRFIGNKAYLVTYRTMDPLFVIDLSNEAKPRVLGELKIPGYSTYLHPYDENHLIGIGMETKETINRDYSGRVISTTAKVTGMKMALFDITDVTNPKQISSTVIGDSRTTSSILTNPKALLFSKEKNLIAIPVNNYNEDFEITTSNDSYSSIVNSYMNYKKQYIAEGYFVYNINLEDGFNLKGTITHENNLTSYPYYRNNSKLLRGLYIDNNLYTVSETAIKVNNLDDLKLINELKIKIED